MSDSIFLDYALAYAKLGWRVIPLPPRSKKCLMKGWPEKATTDVKQIKQWWTESPESNIGIVMGSESNLTGLDFDVGGKPGLENAKILREWQPQMPQPLRVQSASGGLHWYFAYTEGAHDGSDLGVGSEKLQKVKAKDKNGKESDATGVDCKNKGYFVAPPSVTEKGEYKWLDDFNTHVLSPIPNRIVHLLFPPESTPAENTPPAVKNATPAPADVQKRLEESKKSADDFQKELAQLQAAKAAAEAPKINLMAAFEESDVADAIKRSQEPDYKTGFFELDKCLSGGWKAGNLYILGGMPNLGKSALALQFAVKAAEAGFYAVYWSTELAPKTARARLKSYFVNQKIDKNGEYCRFTAREILDGKLYEATHREIFRENESIFKKIAIEGGRQVIDPSYLRAYLHEFCNVQKYAKPLVIVDHLQMMRSKTYGDSDKQQIDGVVFDLKKIAEDFDLPMLVVSTINRTSYSGNFSLGAFKESGSIEYCADLAFGLEHNSEMKDYMDMRKEFFKSIETEGFGRLKLTILKNRDGVSKENLLKFFAPQDRFIEDTDAEKDKKDGAQCPGGKKARKTEMQKMKENLTAVQIELEKMRDQNKLTRLAFTGLCGSEAVVDDLIKKAAEDLYRAQ